MFELLMRRYNERVYRAARAIVRDEQEAEDVMQQAYVNAFTHLRQFKGSAQFSTWLTRIAVNESLARVRRQGRYEAYADDLPNVEPLMSRERIENPERQAFTGELRDLLEQAIDTLSDGMREVFVLRDVEGLEHGGSLRVPRRLGGRSQDPLVARPGGVEARAAGAQRASPRPMRSASIVPDAIGSWHRCSPGSPNRSRDGLLKTRLSHCHPWTRRHSDRQGPIGPKERRSCDSSVLFRSSSPSRSRSRVWPRSRDPSRAGPGHG